MSKFLVFLWLAFAISIWVYSYGFVDFNLTLSPHPVVMHFVTWSQHLAMFHRDRSLHLYLIGIAAVYVIYLVTILRAQYEKAQKFPWWPVIFLASIFACAYPFLSSDVFKYLFAAKELLIYHANPHVVAPQVFEGDTWLRFMRWIHTPSPYGPVMTALALPPYIMAFGKFVPALYLFKLMQLGWYFLSIWLIGRLAQKRAVLAQLLFALNPLILVEWLANAHNDAPMIALLLLALYVSTRQKRAWSLFTILLSIGIKYVTVVFLPFIFLPKKVPLRYIQYSLLIVLALAPLLYHYTYQYQPWYVTWIIPFAALSGASSLIWLGIAYSLGAFLRYIPYIATGLWIGTPTYFALVTFGPVVLTALSLFLISIFKRRSAHHAT